MSTVDHLTSAHLARLADRSLAIILKHQDAGGAYPASPTFSAYRGYCWFRDGAFIADGASAAGAVESASRFFDWCAGILLDRREQVRRIVDAAALGRPVPDSEMLATRFRLDGTTGDDDWWDFQLDGYGTWLWAVVEHSRRHDLPLTRWADAMALSVRYLVSSWRRPCFDWWEEHAEQVHVSTLGCIGSGLEAAASAEVLDAALAAAAREASRSIRSLIAERGVVDGRLAKWLGSGEVDASLLALVSPLRAYPASETVGAATLAAVESQLSVGGGVHRYLADTFYGGGQWPLLSCMLGLGLADAGEHDRAMAQLRWAAAAANADDEMPEQVPEHLLSAEREAEWIQRWGTVARPLLWSHAMYLRLAVRLGVTA